MIPYSAANVIIISKFKKENQINPSPIVLTEQGSEYQQSEERIPSYQMVFLGIF